MAPLSRPMTAGADPPSVLLTDCCAVQARGRQVAGRGQSRVRLPWRTAHKRDLLRTRLRNAREQGANLCLPIPAVTAERTNGRELAGLRPPRHGLGIHAEHRRDLGWRQQRFSFWCACRHVASPPGPILRSCVVPFLAPGGACRGCPHMTPTETILPSPGVTNRPPGARFCGLCPNLVRRLELRCVIVSSPV